MEVSNFTSVFFDKMPDFGTFWTKCLRTYCLLSRRVSLLKDFSFITDPA